MDLLVVLNRSYLTLFWLELSTSSRIEGVTFEFGRAVQGARKDSFIFFSNQ